MTTSPDTFKRVGNVVERRNLRMRGSSLVFGYETSLANQSLQYRGDNAGSSRDRRISKEREPDPCLEISSAFGIDPRLNRPVSLEKFIHVEMKSG